MINVKYSMLFSVALLAAGISGEAKAASCNTVIDELVAWKNAPCHTTSSCVNVINYQMAVMNNKKFVGYANGWLNLKEGYLYTDSAKTLFSDRLWKANCTPGQLCLENQPFDYHRPETFAFKIKKPSIMNLDFTSWNEHYTMNLSCQNGYIYGFQPGKLMVMLYPEKSYQDIPR